MGLIARNRRLFVEVLSVSPLDYDSAGDLLERFGTWKAAHHALAGGLNRASEVCILAGRMNGYQRKGRCLDR